MRVPRRLVVAAALLASCANAPPGAEPPAPSRVASALTEPGDAFALQSTRSRYVFASDGALRRIEQGSEVFRNTAGPLWRLQLAPNPRSTLTPVVPSGAFSVVAEAGRYRLRWAGALVNGRPAIDVEVVASLGASDLRSTWTIAVTNRSDLALIEVEFPRFGAQIGPAAGDEYYLVPLFGGAVVPVTQALATDLVRFVYPGYLTAQVTGLFDPEANRGIYLAARDPGARLKSFGWEPATQRGGVWVRIFPEHMDERGNDLPTTFPIELGPIDGDWYDAARAYRAWATAQRWSPAPLAQRADLPETARSTRFLAAPVNTSSPFDPGVGVLMREYQSRLGLTASQLTESPFLWNVGPRTEEDYTPRPGFVDHALEMRGAGVNVLPYTNPRIVPRLSAEFAATGSPLPGASAKEPDGTPVIEVYDGTEMVVLCPAAAATRERHRALAERLARDVAVRGIHLDQIGGANPVLCFDRTHGHPIGGGTWWADGIRGIATEARAGGRMYEPAFTLITEDPGEVLTDVVDLHTNHYTLGSVVRVELRGSAPVPLLAAVYHDRTAYIMSASAVPSTMTQQTYDAVHAFGYLIGNRLTQIDVVPAPPAAPPPPARDLTFLRRLVDSYGVGAPYLHLGEMRRAPTITGSDVIDVTVPHPYTGGEPATLSFGVARVAGTLWAAPDGTQAVVLANPSGETATVTVSLGKSRHGLPGGTVEARRIYGAGLPENNEAVLGTFPEDVSFPAVMGPRSVLIVRLARLP